MWCLAAPERRPVQGPQHGAQDSAVLPLLRAATYLRIPTRCDAYMETARPGGCHILLFVR